MRRDTNPDVKQVGLSLRNISQRKVIKKLKVVTRLLENRLRGRAFVASLCKRKKKEKQRLNWFIYFLVVFLLLDLLSVATPALWLSPSYEIMEGFVRFKFCKISLQFLNSNHVKFNERNSYRIYSRCV